MTWTNSRSAIMPAKSDVIAISSIDNAVPLSIVRCASPARRRGAPNPIAISAAVSSMSMVVLTSPSPSQVPFHPQTAAKPPRFVLGRRFYAETKLINPEEPY